MGSLAVALPRPSPVSLSVCPVWYILTDLLCPQRWGLWSILTRPPCPSSSSWLCLSCALWGPFVWAALYWEGLGGWLEAECGGEEACLLPLLSPVVGSLNCLYGGVPVLNFIYLVFWGFVVYMYI